MSTDSRMDTGTIAWFTRNPVAANLLMLMILIGGISTALKVRTEAFPPFPPNSLTIEVVVPGVSADEVEESVAIKIEQALEGLEGVKEMSTSVEESSASVTVTKTESYSLSKLKEAVKSRVDSISTFPLQAERPRITVESDERHVLNLDISGEVDENTLSKAAKRIRDQLLAMPQVSRVALGGLVEKEISIEVSELALRQYGLSIETIALAVQQHSVSLLGGSITTDYGTINLRTRQQGYYSQDFARTVVRHSADGALLRLSDIATVRETPIEKELFSRFNGQSSLSLNVSLQGNDSVTTTADAVKDQIGSIQSAGWLPEGIELTIWADSSKMIRDRLGLMINNALTGMLLVVLMLALFLNLRIALWVAVGIPVSFAGTMILMGPHVLNYSLNELTTFGFIAVLGIVVDDAVVIGESIYSEKEAAGANDPDPVGTTVTGAMRVATPATFGVLTTVAAFLPLTLVGSQMAAMFSAIAVVVIACLLFSLIESKWMLPAHLAHLQIHADDVVGRNRLSVYWGNLQAGINAALRRFVERRYQPLLRTTLAHRYSALCIFLALFASTMALVPGGQVRTVFFPNIESGNVRAKLVMNSGAGTDKLDKAARQIEAAALQTRGEYLKQFPDDVNAVRHSYSASTGNRSAAFFIELASDAERSFTSDDLVKRWRKNIGDLDGVKSLNIFAEGASEGVAGIEIYLSASSSDQLKPITDALKTELRSFKGISNVKTGFDEGELELDVRLKPVASTLGLSEGDVAQQIRNVFYGYEVQRIQRGNDEIRAWVRYPKADRNQFSDLSKVFIRTPAGDAVPLDTVATLTRTESPVGITRINQRRVVSVSAKSDKASASASRVLSLLQTDFFPKLQSQYPGLTILVAGEAAEANVATGSLFRGFLLALAMIYGLLAIPLKSYTEPLVIMSAIPFGIIGAITGHLIIGIPMSILSFFGLLALSGVVVNDALVLTSRFNDFRHTGLGFSEAISEATRSRFRAILLTSITTFVGLLPLMFERSEQAQFLKPMAVSLAYGILFATVINLLIVPVLLTIREDIQYLLGNRLKATTRHNEEYAK